MKERTRHKRAILRDRRIDQKRNWGGQPVLAPLTGFQVWLVNRYGGFDRWEGQ